MLANRIDFGGAIREMRTGDRVSRDGWNGADQWIRYVDLSNDREFELIRTKEAVGEFTPFFVLKNVQGSLIPWTPSQTDQLAEDWFVLKRST